MRVRGHVAQAENTQIAETHLPALEHQFQIRITNSPNNISKLSLRNDFAETGFEDACVEQIANLLLIHKAAITHATLVSVMPWPLRLFTRVRDGEYTVVPTEERLVNKSQLLKKIAERQPRLADHVRLWALPTLQRFPLDTDGLTKAAARAFGEQLTNMSPGQRLECARNIDGRARELGLDLSDTLVHKYACRQLAAHFASDLALRKEATAHMVDDELNKLLKVAEVFNTKSDVNGLDKVASALEDFDRRHNLSGHWDHWLHDPVYAVYGLTADVNENVEPRVKVAGEYDVGAGDLDGADWGRLDGKLPTDVVEGLRTADNKLAVFASLPAPEREIIFQSLFM